MRQLELNESTVNITARYSFLRATQDYWPEIWRELEQYLIGVFESDMDQSEKEVLADNWFRKYQIHDDWFKEVIAATAARWSFNLLMKPSNSTLDADWFYFPLDNASQPILLLITPRTSRKFYPLDSVKPLFDDIAPEHKADFLAYLRANEIGRTESNQEFKDYILEDVERQIDEYLRLDEQTFSERKKKPATSYHARWTVLYQQGKSAEWIRLNDHDGKHKTKQAIGQAVTDFAKSIGLTLRKPKAGRKANAQRENKPHAQVAL